MRIIRGPHDPVRTDVIGQHTQTAFDGLERDPAVAPEELARPHLEGRIVEEPVVEMPIHTVDPGRDPAAAALEKGDAKLREALDNAAPDDTQAGEHHLHGVRDDVTRTAALG